MFILSSMFQTPLDNYHCLIYIQIDKQSPMRQDMTGRQYIWKTVLTNSTPSRLTFYYASTSTQQLFQFEVANDEKDCYYRIYCKIEDSLLYYYETKRQQVPNKYQTILDYFEENWRIIFEFKYFPRIYLKGGYSTKRQEAITIAEFYSTPESTKIKAQISLNILNFIKTLKLQKSNQFRALRRQVLDFIKQIELPPTFEQQRALFLSLFDIVNLERYKYQIKGTPIDPLIDFKKQNRIEHFNFSLTTQQIFSIILSDIEVKKLFSARHSSGKSKAIGLLYIFSSCIQKYREDISQNKSGFSSLQLKDEIMLFPKIFKMSIRYGYFCYLFYQAVEQQLPYQLKIQQIPRTELLERINQYYQRLNIKVIYVVDQIHEYQYNFRQWGRIKPAQHNFEQLERVGQLLDRLNQYTVVYVAQECPFKTKNNQFMYRKVTQTIQCYYDIEQSKLHKQSSKIISNIQTFQFFYSSKVRDHLLQELKKPAEKDSKSSKLQTLKSLQCEFDCLYRLYDVEEFCQQFRFLEQFKQGSVRVFLLFTRQKYQVYMPIVPGQSKDPVIVKESFFRFFKTLQKELQQIKIRLKMQSLNFPQKEEGDQSWF